MKNAKTKMEKKQVIILSIIIVLVIFIIIVMTIMSILYLNNKKSLNINNSIDINNEYENNWIDINSNENNIKGTNSNFIKNNTNENNERSSGALDVIEESDLWKENEPISEEKRKLTKVTDKYSYFLTKQSMTSFYISQYHAYNVLPIELRQYDISNFYKDDNLSEYCIDSIYKASISGSKDVYYVYYRVQNSSESAENKTALVKIDRKNLSFAIYPYEYLQTINYSSLKENDIISTDLINISDIERTELNHYKVDNISKDDETTLNELLERFQFDVKFDKEYLYSRIDSTYKTIRFNNNYENFLSFINSKKDEYIKDKLKSYQVYNLKNYTQYIAQCKNDNIFVFNITNLMNYSVQFDMYTTVTPVYYKIYSSNFPKVQGKYCIDRIRRAINDKNYEFIFAKLSDTQKANYNFDTFSSFIENAFYEHNTFEIEKIEKITDASFIYTVKVTGPTGNGTSSTMLKMTVTLKENADFDIIIRK